MEWGRECSAHLNLCLASNVAKFLGRFFSFMFPLHVCFRIELDYPTQPPMLTIKQFLLQQDDSISDQDAIKKYNEYKMEFKKNQITDFFLSHKDEEW